MSEPKPKPFEISKWAVWEAYRRVKANKGAAGVDEQSIEEFEQDLSGNLYTLWNRLSSGSYFPPPVRAVEIPKKDGGSRVLGVPTVADRIAQVVVRSYLEPDVEPVFHEDSYGYRPGRSAIRSPVCGSLPGLIDPSDISTAGALCSRIAASVPTGGLSHATTAISPAMLFAFRCRSMLSFTSSRPINEKRIPGVPFSCPSETPIVYAGAISRTARSSLRTRSDSALWTAATFPSTPR